MGRPEIASSLAPWAAAWPARGGAGPAEGVLPSGEADGLMEGVLPSGEADGLAEGVLPSGGAGVLVPGVMLLGVRVAAWVIIDLGEHRRRGAAGVGAVVSPGLLDRLMDLPAGVPVMDPVVWVEMAGQPAGVVERGEDGVSVTR